jgi:hypothetical protein|tara:strand:+ start:170 stop:307 length:138 start_codon:yes stop_codon:yes gene_type:complete
LGWRFRESGYKDNIIIIYASSEKKSKKKKLKKQKQVMADVITIIV